MPKVTFSLDGHIALVTLNDGENRFNPPFLKTFSSVLDEIEHRSEVSTLVVASAHEKIFSNGIDLQWLEPVLKADDREAVTAFLRDMMGLFRRILLYPMPTIAAISGHAFAGGAIMSCAFDFRFMRSDRGFFCFPEVDLGIPFLPGMLAIIGKAIPAPTFQEMQLTGRRATAKECEAAGIVLKAFPRDDLISESVEFAKSLNKRRAVVSEMKQRMYKEVVRILDEEDPPLIDSGRFFV